MSSGAGEDCPASAISRSEPKLGEAESTGRGIRKRVCNLNTNAQYSWEYNLSWVRGSALVRCDKVCLEVVTA